MAVLLRDPLIVYAPEEVNFATNGLRLLQPISATYTVEMNQAGEIHIEHPIDEEGDWRTLLPWYTIHAPIPYRGSQKWQPFRIFRRVKKRGADGKPVVAIDARHMFYDLGFVALEDVRPENLNGQDAIQWLFDHAYDPSGSSVLPLDNFTFSSDIITPSTSYYVRKTVAGALIGEDNCILERWGGELYVDGLYFSINSVMENSLQNAFYITHGINLSEVEETVDVTDTFSQFAAVDNYGNTAHGSVPLTYSGLPYEKTLYGFFNYSDDMTTQQRQTQFGLDFGVYMGIIQEVSVSYKVRVHELPHDDPFRALESYEVGDYGQIRDDDLGIETTQRIMKKTIDLLTGDTLSIETGNLAKSIARKQPFANTIS